MSIWRTLCLAVTFIHKLKSHPFGYLFSLNSISLALDCDIKKPSELTLLSRYYCLFYQLTVCSSKDYRKLLYLIYNQTQLRNEINTRINRLVFILS